MAVSNHADTRHGVILAKSQEAKRYGINTGEPVIKALKKCPGLILCKADFSAYNFYSQKIIEIYKQYTDQIEPFGLDEAWLDVTASQMLYGRGMDIAQEISNRIKAELKITVSIGVSFCKIFAKLGSDYKKPDAITEITKENFKDIIWPLPVENLLYVGSNIRKKLNLLGIRTIGQLSQFPLSALEENLGKQGKMLYEYASGLDNSPVLPVGTQRLEKSIGNSTTTTREMKNIEDIKIVLHILVDSIGKRLRKKELVAKTLSLSIRDTQFSTISRQTQLSSYTNSTEEIFQTALSLFKQHYFWKKPVRNIGVHVANLKPIADSYTQLDLFSSTNEHKHTEALDLAIDGLKSRFGSNSVCCAILLKDKELSSFFPNSH